MNFQYTASVYVSSDELRRMCKRVKNGEDFNFVYNDIMSEYDDIDYYASGYVKEDVYQEILRRLNQSVT